MKIRTLLRLFRVHQYTKNLFVIAPAFFGLELTDFELLDKLFNVFLAFCLASSAVYIANDLYSDPSTERNNPLVNSRPIQSGLVSDQQADYWFKVTISLAYLIAGLNVNIEAFRIILAYTLLNVLYTLLLKKFFMVDLLVIVAGFELRVMAGCAAIGHEMTAFLTLEIFVVCSMLVMAKRLYENLTIKDSARPTVKRYTKDLCLRNIITMAVTSNIIYVLYCFYGESIPHVRHHGYMYLSCGIVMLASLRFVSLAKRERLCYNITNVFLKDWALMTLSLVWTGIVTYALYF
ncbi:UbiA family prenyltransferase [Succinivibrio sp.]|uniref:UbiA family prenyltransferase n=1 Tax=Succinivibrio sp. TaxID=2053619 RepID=UPI00386E6576